jgi:hypothetical protein
MQDHVDAEESWEGKINHNGKNLGGVLQGGASQPTPEGWEEFGWVEAHTVNCMMKQTQ